MTIILQYKIIMSVVFVLFLAGVIIQLLLSHFYTVLIDETENMATTEVPILYQCKRKFSNNFRLHNGVMNVSVFVEKYLSKIKMGKLTVSTWKHLSGQIVMFSVFVAGLGACKGIVDGKTLGEILPFYIISMFDLYLYFAISGFVDIEQKKRILKINLVDYLENRMGNKLEELEVSMKYLEDEEKEFPVKGKQEFKDAILQNRRDKAELEELLREFLA